MPLLSNVEDGVDVYGVPAGNICVYEIDVSDNDDSSEILEIEVTNVQNARIGADFIRIKEDGTNQTLDAGFWNKDNCSMEVNCTKNMRGKHVYYLSGVQKLYLTVISTAGDNSTAAELQTQYDIDFFLRVKTTSVQLYLASSFALLIAFGVAYTKGVDYMKEQMNEDNSYRNANQEIESQHQLAGDDENLEPTSLQHR